MKVFAILLSSFEEALFLDCDNTPVSDPTIVFLSRDYLNTGAVFWPDRFA
jgi:alpha 1,2-mannosyltransferase